MIVFLLFQILYSFLSIGWGLIADIDIESERLRSIGGQRFTVWSLARLVGKSMKIPAK
jgi:sphingosine kinase